MILWKQLANPADLERSKKIEQVYFVEEHSEESLSDIGGKNSV